MGKARKDRDYENILAGQRSFCLCCCGFSPSRRRANRFCENTFGNRDADPRRHFYPAGLGSAVYESDWLQTGTDGQVGVTFRDNTLIALGPESRIQLAHFVFKPAAEQYGFLMRLAHGTLECISGLTTKLAPDAMSIETPGFTVGARGTRFLVRSE